MLRERIRANMQKLGVAAPAIDAHIAARPNLATVPNPLEEIITQKYIANILKCRPPNNRDPSEGEAAACRSYLERQIELMSPRLILAVGRIGA